jgi:hypothetical protein
MQRTFTAGAIAQIRWGRGSAGWNALCLLLLMMASCLVLQGLPCMAQMDQGTISGTVTDSSGAVVPDAKVTLTENDTGLVLQSVANKGGVYVFSPVKIGNER